MSIKKKNLDLYLAEVFKQYIAIEDNEYKKSQEVFIAVFNQVKQKMEEQCNYFKKYSRQVQYAGSVYDGIKVSKLDEFDMDIVIRLPINYDEGIIVENDQPGFVKLKIGEAFDLLDKQQEWENCHKATRDWRDTDKYLLQSKFRQWLHGIVQKAINEMNGRAVVNDVIYFIEYKESGPAFTLKIKNGKGNPEFNLDVDLVPVIRFQYPRWPEGYRTIEDSSAKDWYVVPKPNKYLNDGKMKNRCWRLSFQEFERDMMKECQQLKTTIRLVKKLRDSLQMKCIASYYIKTLFLWKIDEEKDKKYWQKSLSVMFRTMVEVMYKAIKDKKIPYFWHKEHNLIENLKPTIQKVYVDKLKEVIDALEANNVDKIVESLLTTMEFQGFKKSEFYVKQPAVAKVLTVQLSRQESISSTSSNSSNEKVKKTKSPSTDDIDGQNQVADSLKHLCSKIDMLAAKINMQNSRMEKLEQDLKVERERVNDKLDLILEKLIAQEDEIKRFKMEKGASKNIVNDNHNITANCSKAAIKIDQNSIRLADEIPVAAGEMVINIVTDSGGNLVDLLS